MVRAFLACGLALSSLMVGCSSDDADDDEDDSGTGPVSLDAFGSRTARYFCGAAFRCCTSAELAAQGVTSQSQCQLGLGQLFSSIGAEIEESVAKGRVSYDAAAYGACLTQAGSGDCAEAGETALDACAALAITPLVEAGGACQQQPECIDSACVGSDTSTNRDGVCATPLPDGSACTSSGECESGSCALGSCEAKAQNGVDCFEDDDCLSDHCDTEAFVCAAETASVCD